MSAAAAFSGALAAYCLGQAFASAALGPLGGFVAALTAAVALGRAARGGDQDGPLRVCPRRGVLSGEGRDGETPLLPIGVTRSLICLAPAGGGRPRRSIWRDSIAPDAFRRIAAYGLWHRSAGANRVDPTELIARRTVTGGPSDSRIGGPPGQ
jgi:hypothetical protein